MNLDHRAIKAIARVEDRHRGMRKRCRIYHDAACENLWPRHLVQRSSNPNYCLLTAFFSERKLFIRE